MIFRVYADRDKPCKSRRETCKKPGNNYFPGNNLSSNLIKRKNMAITENIPISPYPDTFSACKNALFILVTSYLISASISPPAMTEPIWPATLAPTACISKKLDGSSFCPILCITLADIGKADIPAAPIMGFIFFFRKILRVLTNITPPAVSKTNASRPIPKISNV